MRRRLRRKPELLLRPSPSSKSRADDEGPRKYGVRPCGGVFSPSRVSRRSMTCGWGAIPKTQFKFDFTSLGRKSQSKSNSYSHTVYISIEEEIDNAAKIENFGNHDTRGEFYCCSSRAVRVSTWRTPTSKHKFVAVILTRSGL